MIVTVTPASTKARSGCSSIRGRGQRRRTLIVGAGRAGRSLLRELRETPGLKKKPSTSELLDWLKLILAEDLSPEDLKRPAGEMLPKLHGALVKNEQDVALFERLAFMARRQAR